jgi:hypothetical protein
MVGTADRLGAGETMNVAQSFCYTRLAGQDRNWQPLYESLRSIALPALLQDGVELWGVWFGLFGMASNELVLMTASRQQSHVAQLNARLSPLPCTVCEQHVLAATVRPTDTTPLTRPGLYVLRFFDVYDRDVDEIVALSQQAWSTFETATTYRAQALGLFRLYDRSQPRGIMLLCMWYDGFDSWQISRDPAPEAKANFQRRHELTLATRAVATRLIPRIS